MNVTPPPTAARDPTHGRIEVGECRGRQHRSRRILRVDGVPGGVDDRDLVGHVGSIPARPPDDPPLLQQVEIARQLRQLIDESAKQSKRDDCSARAGYLIPESHAAPMANPSVLKRRRSSFFILRQRPTLAAYTRKEPWFYPTSISSATSPRERLITCSRWSNSASCSVDFRLGTEFSVFEHSRHSLHRFGKNGCQPAGHHAHRNDLPGLMSGLPVH